MMRCLLPLFAATSCAFVSVAGEPLARARSPGAIHPLVQEIAALLTNLSTPFAAGSLLSVLVALGSVAIVVHRTRIEDGYRSSGLAGFEDDARRVRWRLLPGVI